MLVRDVIGEFELVERDCLLHPLLSSAGRVRVNVHSLGHLRVGFTGNHPAGIVELVTAVVGGHDVHQEDVLGFLVQARNPYFE